MGFCAEIVILGVRLLEMKKVLLVLFGVICSYSLSAQEIDEDSLLHVIYTARDDSVKVDAINAFSFGYYTPDTSFYYARKILAAGNALHNKLVIAMGMAKMATSYLRVQEDTKLLETGLAALKMAEPYNNPVVMATIYDIVGAGYRLDPQKDMEYELKAIDIINHHPPNRFYVIILNNYAENLLIQGQFRLALQYSQQAYQMSLLFDEFEAPTFINGNLAAINLALGNRELAKTYYNLNLTEARQKHYNKLYYMAYKGLGDYYEKTGQPDTAAYYLMAMDSLSNQKKVIQVQNISVEEELRQQTIQQAKEADALSRKYDLQLAMLALGIICAAILFLMLSRSIVVSHKLVAFLGVLLLLVSFEFINLLVHPFLESVTHDSPALMLLALVTIAALLVPIHHRLEKWATVKLVEKNKEVRLKAAKRTIRQLEENI